jgi:hypothetical protein
VRINRGDLAPLAQRSLAALGRVLMKPLWSADPESNNCGKDYSRDADLDEAAGAAARLEH